MNVRLPLALLLFIGVFFSFKVNDDTLLTRKNNVEGVLKKDSLEWVLIYYMPYDNNLSDYAKTIIDDIKIGVQSDKILAVIQTDYQGEGGMSRYIISNDSIQELKLTDEYSANISSFSTYLKWVRDNFKFKKSMLAILDHGGKLNEIGLDQYPDRKFLKINEIRSVLEEHNEELDDKVDLLFLQVCSKSSIEVFYEFKDVSNFTLASQIELKAPNKYYRSTFENLSKNQCQNGLELAKMICENESRSMYSSYTCIDNSKFKYFKKEFDELLMGLYEEVVVSFSRRPISITYAGEEYWDFISFLRSIELENFRDQKYLERVISVVENDLITFVYINPEVKAVKKYSGCSIRSLGNNFDSDECMRYWNLKFYSDFELNYIDFYLY